MEKALKALSESGDTRSQEEIQQSLKDALEKLSQQQKQLSEALQKLARERGEKGDGMQIPKELAELLRRLAQQQPQRGSRSQQSSAQTEQSLQSLLAALQNLKFGEAPGDEPGTPTPGPGELQLSQNPGPGGIPGQGEGDPRLPSGRPGSEHDTGTTKSPFGNDPAAKTNEGMTSAIAGRLGAGESLQQFLPGASDASKAQRRYKELYDAMAPAAQDAVVQENIPLGSRFLIKRYFEAIRPRE